MNFDSIRKRRTDFGFGLDDIARTTGLTPSRIEDIEAGCEPIYLDELTRVAQALAFDAAAWMKGEDLGHPGRAVARFRSEAGGALGPVDLRLMARAAQLARIGESLRLMLGDPPSAISTRRHVKPIARGRIKPHEQGYRLGASARIALAPEPGPLRSVQGLLEATGVHVALVDFEAPAIDAVSLYEPDAVPTILLNRRKARIRQAIPRRAAMAHELCHLLHDARGARDLVTLISWRDSREPEEQRANGFAPAFVAPPQWLGEMAGEPEERVRVVGERWGLSAEGAVWHCKNCKLIEADVAEYLSRNLPKVARDRSLEPRIERLVLDAASPAEPSPLCRGLLSDLVVRAYAADHISIGRARELLAWR